MTITRIHNDILPGNFVLVAGVCYPISPALSSFKPSYIKQLH